MKKLLTMMLMLAMITTLWANGTTETEEPIEISILHSGSAILPGIGDEMQYAIDKTKEDFPTATFDNQMIDLADGSAITMTAYLAAGRAPNVYIDTLVRSSAYIRADFALPLDGLVRDLDQYSSDTLAPYRRNGALLALPRPGNAQGMAVNLDLMADIGYTVPDNWTIDDFLEMCALIEAKYPGKKWGTGMFAANQSGDYLVNNWFASFGVDYYKAGDYSKTTIKETGGEKVHAFFQLLAQKGYIPPGAADLTDDDYVLNWARGELGATAFFQLWIKPYFDVVAEQGYKPFNYKFIPFPRDKGVSKVPTYYMTLAIVVHRTGTNQDPVAARFAEYLNSAEVQTEAVGFSSVMANRLDVTVSPDDQWTAQILDIVRTQGIFDVGLTNRKYSITRPQHFPVLQKVLNLKITPADSIAEYEKKLNEALK